MRKVIVIGGGAAGMMCAVFAARGGAKVELFEKNEKLGKKIFITGKGRCNLTNATDMDGVLNSIVSNRKFMYSSLRSFSNADVMEFFESLGLKLKVERGMRVFPESDHAYDVTAALRREMERLAVGVRLHTKISDIINYHGECQGVIDEGGNKHIADSVVVATGGLSYPSTGSTGDGYAFARSNALTVNATSPSLVSMRVSDKFISALQGLSLKNVALTLTDGERVLYRDFGELLFTHFGISGPIVLTASSLIKPDMLRAQKIKAHLDLKRALDAQTLDRRLIREFEQNSRRQFKNSLGGLFPAKLIPVMAKRSKIEPTKLCGELTREERRSFGELIKNFDMTVTGLGGFDEAVVTKGGVSVKEIDPKTMEAKKVKGLYFAGEVLDVDALTGGFNLQIAWSTGAAAGRAAAGRQRR